MTTDFSTDALQDLNLRAVVGGGLGWHAIKRDTTTLDILAGVNYTNENYTQIAPVPNHPTSSTISSTDFQPGRSEMNSCTRFPAQP